MQRIRESSQLEDVFSSKRALLFKHSTRCSISSWVKDSVAAFAEVNPEIPVYVLQVVEDRPLSQLVEERTGIRHESPQALLIESGLVVSSGSHFEIENVLNEASTGGA